MIRRAARRTAPRAALFLIGTLAVGGIVASRTAAGQAQDVRAGTDDAFDRARETLRTPTEAILLYRFDGGPTRRALRGTILTQAGVQHAAIGGDADAWRRTVERFTLVLREPGFGWDAANAARALHDRLLKPLLSALDPPDLTRAIIVADAPLRSLPFSALAPRDHPYRSWFGFLTAIAYAPDLDAVIASSTRPTATTGRPPHLVVIADDDARRTGEVEDAVQCGSPASRRIDRATNGYGDAPVEWIHAAMPIDPAAFAARLPERPEFVLAPYVAPSATRGDPVRVAAPLLAAGAGTVLTTRWDLEPRVIRKFVGRFYHHLGDGHDRAEALVATKREFSRSPGFGGPSTWAAFALVGDPATPTKTAAPWRWYTLWWYVALVACLLFGYRIASVLADDARARSQAAGETPRA